MDSCKILQNIEIFGIRFKEPGKKFATHVCEIHTEEPHLENYPHEQAPLLAKSTSSFEPIKLLSRRHGDSVSARLVEEMAVKPPRLPGLQACFVLFIYWTTISNCLGLKKGEF